MLKYWLVEIRDRECKLVDQTRLPGDASKVQRQDCCTPHVCQAQSIHT